MDAFGRNHDDEPLRQFIGRRKFYSFNQIPFSEQVRAKKYEFEQWAQQHPWVSNNEECAEAYNKRWLPIERMMKREMHDLGVRHVGAGEYEYEAEAQRDLMRIEQELAHARQTNNQELWDEANRNMAAYGNPYAFNFGGQGQGGAYQAPNPFGGFGNGGGGGAGGGAAAGGGGGMWGQAGGPFSFAGHEGRWSCEDPRQLYPNHYYHESDEVSTLRRHYDNLRPIRDLSPEFAAEKSMAKERWLEARERDMKNQGWEFTVDTNPSRHGLLVKIGSLPLERNRYEFVDNSEQRGGGGAQAAGNFGAQASGPFQRERYEDYNGSWYPNPHISKTDEIQTLRRDWENFHHQNKDLRPGMPNYEEARKESNEKKHKYYKADFDWHQDRDAEEYARHAGGGAQAAGGFGHRRHPDQDAADRFIQRRVDRRQRHMDAAHERRLARHREKVEENRRAEEWRNANPHPVYGRRHATRETRWNGHISDNGIVLPHRVTKKARVESRDFTQSHHRSGRLKSDYRKHPSWDVDVEQPRDTKPELHRKRKISFGAAGSFGGGGASAGGDQWFHDDEFPFMPFPGFEFSERRMQNGKPVMLMKPDASLGNAGLTTIRMREIKKRATVEAEAAAKEAKEKRQVLTADALATHNAQFGAAGLFGFSPAVGTFTPKRGLHRYKGAMGYRRPERQPVPHPPDADSALRPPQPPAAESKIPGPGEAGGGAAAGGGEGPTPYPWNFPKTPWWQEKYNEVTEDIQEYERLFARSLNTRLATKTYLDNMVRESCLIPEQSWFLTPATIYEIVKFNNNEDAKETSSFFYVSRNAAYYLNPDGLLWDCVFCILTAQRKMSDNRRMWLGASRYAAQNHLISPDEFKSSMRGEDHSLFDQWKERNPQILMDAKLENLKDIQFYTQIVYACIAIQQSDYNPVWTLIHDAYKAGDPQRAVELACGRKLTPEEIQHRLDRAMQGIPQEDANYLLMEILDTAGALPIEFEMNQDPNKLYAIHRLPLVLIRLPSIMAHFDTIKNRQLASENPLTVQAMDLIAKHRCDLLSDLQDPEARQEKE